MRKKLEQEIEKMIEARTEVLVVTEGEYTRHVDPFSHTEILWLILSHLELEPNIRCRHPETVLKSTATKKNKND